MAIQFLRGTTSQWASHENDPLMEGQPGIEYCDNGEIRMKVGNPQGDAWKDLPYIGLFPFLVQSWKQVQEVVKLGLAPRVFKVGDQLTCNHSVFGELVFDIVGFDQEDIVDTTKQHSMTLNMHDLLDAGFQFDAAEPDNPDTNRSKYGNSNWRDSNIRQWLNSSGAAGSWFSPTTDYDTAPSYASTYAGFMLGLDEDFKSVIGPVVKTTANNTVTDGGGSYTTQDTIFIPSLTEVYGGLNNSISEGEAYTYFSENSSLSSPGIGSDRNRIKQRNGSNSYYWLRSPRPSNSYYARYVTGNGYGSFSNATHNVFGVAAACAVIG